MTKRRVYTHRRGSVLILALIFIVMFSALATAMATMSGTMVQVASNEHHANQALANAESGLETLRYYLGRVSLSASVAPEDRLETLATKLENAFALAGVENFEAHYDSGTHTVNIPSILLDSEAGESFSATLGYATDPNFVNVAVTGTSGQVSKSIGLSFGFVTVGNPMFNHGIATKGPLKTLGSVEVEGFNESVEASVYIESPNSLLALDMQSKSAIAGSVEIANRLAVVDIDKNSSVGGSAGDEAMENITVGAQPCDFPEPNPGQFKKYITRAFDAEVDATSDVTLTNIEILPNTNPKFTGNAKINGILYIHSPNVVQFGGNAEVMGMIVAEGDLESPSEENRIEFHGTLNSYDASNLPKDEFGGLTEETGTFILAPGFSTLFGGDFEQLNGVIAASGVEFFGNAGGTINGSIINYADTVMTLQGNTNLVFNRSGVEESPAGFEPIEILQALPTSYAEHI